MKKGLLALFALANIGHEFTDIPCDAKPSNNPYQGKGHHRGDWDERRAACEKRTEKRRAKKKFNKKWSKK